MHSGNQAAPQRSAHTSQTLCTFKTIYFLLDICTLGAINYIVQMSCMSDREKPQNTCISCHNLQGVRTTRGCVQVQSWGEAERCEPWAALTQREEEAEGALAMAAAHLSMFRAHLVPRLCNGPCPVENRACKRLLAAEQLRRVLATSLTLSLANTQLHLLPPLQHPERRHSSQSTGQGSCSTLHSCSHSWYLPKASHSLCRGGGTAQRRWSHPVPPHHQAL